MSIFGKLAKESPEFIDEFLRALRGEASDATPKLGSGTNLEALQRAQADIAEQARQVPTPDYPTNIVQDELAQSSVRGKGFKLEGQPYTKEGVMQPEGVDLPAIRTQTLPETPSTFRAGDVDTTGRVISEAEDLANIKAGKPLRTEIKPEATGLASTAEELKGSMDNLLSPGILNRVKNNVDDIAEKVSNMKYPSPMAQATAGTIGGVALGLNMYGGDKDQKQETQIPLRPKDDTQKVVDKVQEKKGNLEKEETQSPEQAKKQAKNKPVITEEDEQKVVQIGQKLFEDPKSVQKEDIDYLKMLQSAQENDNQSRFVNNLLRAGTTIGAAIAGVKPDYSGVDALASQIGQTKQVKEQMETDMGQKKLEAAQRELNDDKALRDPNSEISKQMRDSLVKAGYPVSSNVSAKNLKDMGVNVYNLLAQKQQQDAALKLSQMTKLEKTEALTDKQDAKMRGEITSMVTNLNKSKDFIRYNSAKEALDSLNLAIETGDKTAIGSAFMKFAKEAQGDDSVVRDGDMRILAGGYNFLSPSQMITKLAAKAQGGDFNKSELNQMKRVVEQGIEARQKRLQQQASPIFARIDKSKMDESIFIDPSLASELRGIPKQDTDQSMKPKEKTVTVKRLSDGMTKVVPVSQTVNLDKTKYEIIGQ